MPASESKDVDLLQLALHQREALGETLFGDIVGRTRLIREVASAIECAEVEAEIVVDALADRRLVECRQDVNGIKYWKVGPARTTSRAG